MRRSSFLSHLRWQINELHNQQGRSSALFKYRRCHPSLAVVPIIETTLLWCLFLEAPRFCCLTNENWLKFLTAISIAGKPNSNTKFIFLFSTKLACCQTMIRWGTVIGLDTIIVINKICLLRKECCLVKIKTISWCKPCQSCLASLALDLHCHSVYWACLSMLSMLPDVVSLAKWVQPPFSQ